MSAVTRGLAVLLPLVPIAASAASATTELYDGLLSEQSKHDKNDLTVFKLPDGTNFTNVATGGDGGFPLLAFYDAEGAQLALLVDLTRRNPAPFSAPACG